MSTTSLKATLRTIQGHKVKNLRKQGFIPATVYGKNATTISVSVPEEDFLSTYEKTGETGLIELVLATEKRPVLVYNVQRHPLQQNILHVEFHQVDLHEKVTAPVPLKFIGDSPAVKDNKGTLLTLIDELEIRALPTELPDHLEVDISVLSDVDQEITVSSIVVPSGVEIMTDTSVAIARIAAQVKEEIVETPTTEAAAGAPSEVAPATTDAEKSPKEG